MFPRINRPAAATTSDTVKPRFMTLYVSIKTVVRELSEFITARSFDAVSVKHFFIKLTLLFKFKNFVSYVSLPLTQKKSVGIQQRQKTWF